MPIWHTFKVNFTTGDGGLLTVRLSTIIGWRLMPEGRDHVNPITLFLSNGMMYGVISTHDEMAKLLGVPYDHS